MVVNESDIYVVAAKVMHPKPDSVIMSLHSKVNLKIALPARIEPLTFHLFVREPGYGPDYPYANTPIPGRTIIGNYSIGNHDVYTPILNQTSFTKFVHQIVFQKETTMSLRGQTNAYLGVLKSHVFLDKDVHAPCKCARLVGLYSPPLPFSFSLFSQHFFTPSISQLY